MNLNPFECIENEYKLEDVLTKDEYNDYIVNREYRKILNSGTEYGFITYDSLVRCINLRIDWHVLDIGSYQGDYYYIANYNDKWYFLRIGYGSCSGCDDLLACCTFEDYQNLQNKIKGNIREFNTLEELIDWLTSEDNDEHWYISSDAEEIKKYIHKEFNI